MSILVMPVLVIHVVVGVLGLGSLLSVAVVAALARRTVRRSVSANDRDAVLRRVERIGYGMCALIAAIRVLMEAKPF